MSKKVPGTLGAWAAVRLGYPPHLRGNPPHFRAGAKLAFGWTGEGVDVVGRGGEKPAALPWQPAALPCGG